MPSLLPLLMFLILFGCLATLYTEGMWTNAIRLINVVTAGLLAVNFFEPVARWLDGWNASYTYVWDFLALWGLFAFFMMISRELTDRVSKVKVRFLKLADRIGSALLALWIGWAMICFTMMTLHTAPLARNFLFGGFQPEEKMILGLAPDRQWLGFVQKESRGAFGRGATAEELQKKRYGEPADQSEADGDLCVFDRNADFMPKYATRRANLEAHLKKTDSLRVRPAGG
jgi:hypothetical protein